jgi:hypothetical protein
MFAEMIMQYELATEPSGHEYRELLAFCAELSSQVLLIVREIDWLDESALQVLDKLQPFQMTVTEQSEWPGTRLLGHTATVHAYTPSAEVIGILQASANRLYEWQQPVRPEDLCFLRATGKPLLVSIAHERDGYLEISHDEFELLRSRFHNLARYLRPPDPRPSRA